MNRGSRGRGKPPRKVQDVLRKRDGKLSGLLQHARQVAQIDDRFKALLPAEIAEHVHVANLAEGRLILVTPVAAIATRLRMEADAIRQRLAEKGAAEIRAVEVRIQPVSTEPVETHGKRELSAAAKQALKAMGIETESS